MSQTPRTRVPSPRVPSPRVPSPSPRPPSPEPHPPQTLLIVEIETNGYPLNLYASDSSSYPSILQLSWATYELDAKKLRWIGSRHFNLTLNPEEDWDPGAASVHGIVESDARNSRITVEPGVALEEFGRHLRTVTCVVSHNLTFTKRMIQAAAYCERLSDVWPADLKHQELSTMHRMKSVIRIPSTRRAGEFKSPSLAELHEWVWACPPPLSRAYAAKRNVACLANCIAGMVADGVLVLD